VTVSMRSIELAPSRSCRTAHRQNDAVGAMVLRGLFAFARS
jgi:hypothetical protein